VCAFFQNGEVLAHSGNEKIKKVESLPIEEREGALPLVQPLYFHGIPLSLLFNTLLQLTRCPLACLQLEDLL
jgi:hypothetical protein